MAPHGPAAGRGPSRPGSTVLMVHGWNGRGAQLGAFAPELVHAGFRVVTFDTPAHGRSPGRATNLPEISEAIQASGATSPPRAILFGTYRT